MADFATNLKCDDQMNVQGFEIEDFERAAAAILRQVADLLEGRIAKDGSLDLKGSKGRKVGEAYFDFSESADFPHPDNTQH